MAVMQWKHSDLSKIKNYDRQTRNILSMQNGLHHWQRLSVRRVYKNVLCYDNNNGTIVVPVEKLN